MGGKLSSSKPTPGTGLLHITANSLITPDPEGFSLALGSRDDVALTIQGCTPLILDLAKLVADYTQDYSSWFDHQLVRLEVDSKRIRSLPKSKPRQGPFSEEFLDQYRIKPNPSVYFKTWLPLNEAILVDACGFCFMLIRLPSLETSVLRVPFKPSCYLACELANRQILMFDQVAVSSSSTPQGKEAYLLSPDQPDPLCSFHVARPKGCKQYSCSCCPQMYESTKLYATGTTSAPSFIATWSTQHGIFIAYYELPPSLSALSGISLNCAGYHFFPNEYGALPHPVIFTPSPNCLRVHLLSRAVNPRIYTFNLHPFNLESCVASLPAESEHEGIIAAFELGDSSFYINDRAQILSANPSRTLGELPDGFGRFDLVVHSSPTPGIIACSPSHKMGSLDLMSLQRLIEVNRVSGAITPLITLSTDQHSFQIHESAKIGEDLWVMDSTESRNGAIRLLRWSRGSRSAAQ